MIKPALTTMMSYKLYYIPTETKATVDEMLEFLVCRSLQLKDFFRLGKYFHPKDFEDFRRPRPVLIKLTMPWDQRLIILQKSNLQKFKIARLFLP